jgi:pimeloyl-ACP methyl ester carboxylesterase
MPRTSWRICATYAKKKIFVMGHSWGTMLGMKLAQRRPDWLYAYIGVGQIISMREGEGIGYGWALSQTRKAGDAKAVNELTAIGPYPEANGAIPVGKIGAERA